MKGEEIIGGEEDMRTRKRKGKGEGEGGEERREMKGC